VEEGALVRRSDVFNWWKDSKGEGDKKERGEDLSYLHPTLISPGAYYTN